METEEYINRKLSHGRHRIWADVQSRIRTYILSCDLSVFKYDDFITVLDIVKRYKKTMLYINEESTPVGMKVFW